MMLKSELNSDGVEINTINKKKSTWEKNLFNSLIFFKNTFRSVQISKKYRQEPE